MQQLVVYCTHLCLVLQNYNNRIKEILTQRQQYNPKIYRSSLFNGKNVLRKRGACAYMDTTLLLNRPFQQNALKLVEIPIKTSRDLENYRR